MANYLHFHTFAYCDNHNIADLSRYHYTVHVNKADVEQSDACLKS